VTHGIFCLQIIWKQKIVELAHQHIFVSNICKFRSISEVAERRRGGRGAEHDWILWWMPIILVAIP
jgi:hypothetical protein